MVYDNYGAKGTADKAMPKIKPGGVYLLLPGGEDGALSKRPKIGVKQINFGLMCGSGRLAPHRISSWTLCIILSHVLLFLFLMWLYIRHKGFRD